MSLLLNIDTASEKAHVSIAEDGLLLKALWSDSQKEHASFLQTAILELTKLTGLKLSNLDAIAVTAGPGSYTGLRVGMASAKGLCYALKKPLITVSSLEVLAYSTVHLFPSYESVLFCPMIDARRMEVFTAIYDKDLKTFLAPQPMILDTNSFENQLSKNKILFLGSGSEKWRSICNHKNAAFETVSTGAEAMSSLSNSFYQKGQFTELVYSEPYYGKEFQTIIKNNR